MNHTTKTGMLPVNNQEIALLHDTLDHTQKLLDQSLQLHNDRDKS
ncbi:MULTISPECIES: hypothetical protein [unclassified Lactobacillus]|nr:MULTISPECIES: hypothetical protein [unclassified Lactobacillus]